MGPIVSVKKEREQEGSYLIETQKTGQRRKKKVKHAFSAVC